MKNAMTRRLRNNGCAQSSCAASCCPVMDVIAGIILNAKAVLEFIILLPAHG